MRDHLLTLNAGSSSIKFALFDAAADPFRVAPRVAGAVEGLGTDARLRVRNSGQWTDAHSNARLDARATHAQALEAVLSHLRAHAGDLRVAGVGHRIVHGGANFDRARVIDDTVLEEIEALSPLAPLHQPHNIAGVRAAMAAFPDALQVACFDTAFHRTQSPLEQRFAIPRALHDAGLRRYGFHGLSYASVCAQLGELVKGRVLVAHLGSGASLCALRDGRSVATTMSFSPLDGLPMGTRCGRLDPAAVLYLLEVGGLDVPAVTKLLYRESGLAGLSGLSGDMRELEAADTRQAREAIDYFVEQVGREMLGMAGALRGLDRIVFTGGIGENSAVLRARIVGTSEWLGWRIDERTNDALREAAARDGLHRRISAPQSSVDIRVVHSNEEAVIALEVRAAL